ncbi:MAG: hypothetical protein FH759_15440 [Sediminimonas qiaohouensis]|uniref:Uncharacterized protein n=1 Tax=Sediminimonas qiaohouensis TaxID=552061 RepID=A0A7C9LR59_9RHOB|nr:DUF6447 family protein [Sediminimonas qiaohouensis]MTJ06060.1 hypothetical protein [Sediminimonas qiaohouensis]
MAEGQTVTIDGKDYALDDLSEAAKGQLTNLRVVDQEIARLQQQQAIAQTARNAYANALKEQLPKDA